MEAGIEVFISYAHKDEKLRVELQKQLTILIRKGLISIWHDGEIVAGKEWSHEIKTHLNTSHIILLLLSSDFISSEYCYSVEMEQAVKRHEAGEVRVIPVILRPVEWEDAPFGKLQALPKQAKPITKWNNRDDAYLDIVRGIGKAALEITSLAKPGTLINTKSPDPNTELYVPQQKINNAGTLHQLAQDIPEKPLSTRDPNDSSLTEANIAPSTLNKVERTARESERKGIKFSVQKDQNHANLVSMIIQDGADTIFHIELPGEQDTIGGWYIRFTYLRKTQPQELNELLGAIPQLLEVEVDEDAHATYLNMLYALFKWTEKEENESQEQDSAENDIPNLYSLHQQLKHALFNFEVVTSPNNVYYEAIFPHPGQEKLRVSIPSDNFDKSPVQTSQVMLKKALRSVPTYIEYFIHNYSHIQEYVMSADPTTFDVFSGLSKALVKLIRQENANLGIYISLVPDICTFIVKNELDSKEMETYLEPILSSFETAEQKLERLNDIISYFKSNISLTKVEKQFNPTWQKEDEYGTLMHLISLISKYYLKIYASDPSANFWKMAKTKDPLLWLLLTIHQRPLLFLLGQVLLLGIPSFFAYQHFQSGKPGPLMVTASDTVFLFILIWYVFLSLLVFSILVQIIRKRWFYGELLLPRLLGAAVIGLLLLLLNEQLWFLFTQSNPLNTCLLALITYIGTFFYIYIDVTNTIKSSKGFSITNALRESGRFFLVALSEILFVVTIISCLFFPAVFLSIGGDIRNYRFGIYANNPLLPFSFFPSPIILLTGIALFIGTFIEKHWKE